jgi:hypothetical protein
VARMGKRSGGYTVLVSKSENTGRPRRRWEDNIKMDVQGTGWRRGLDWSGSGHRQMTGCS